MGIKIKLAKTAAEIDVVFRARYRVFSQEEGKFPERPDQRVFDHFDALPTACNIAAMVNDEVVGGMRITEDYAAGLPSQHYYDFSPFLPEHGAKIASTSMFCLQRDYRAMRKIAFMILCMSCYWGIRRGITHVVAPINPAIEPIIKMVGFKRVSEVIVHKGSGMEILPMMLAIDDMQDRFLEFAKHHRMDEWLESFDREFFKASEPVIRRGDTADCAYIVVDGTLQVSIPKSEGHDDVVINEMSRGELFGELALLIDSNRVADVTALTDCDLMVIDRETFQSDILGNPKHVNTALALLGKRLANVTQMLD